MTKNRFEIVNQYFGNENLIYIPVFKKSNDKMKANSSVVKYKDVLEQTKNPVEVNKEIEKRASLFSNEKLEWDIYIDSSLSDIQVINVDDYDKTVEVFNEISKLNSEFSSLYERLNREIFSKTLTVKTKSGGRHYYIKRKIDEGAQRIVNCNNITNYLDNETISNNSILKTVKNGKIPVDYLVQGVVKSPWHHSIVCGEERVYDIINDNSILQIDESLEEILQYFFRFNSKNK